MSIFSGTRFFGLQRPKPTPTPARSSVLYRPYAIEDAVTQLAKLADPDQVLQKIGMERWELKKMENDDEISAALETRRDALISTPWRLDPFEGEPAEWVWNQIEPHMDVLLRSLWAAVPYGYAIAEVVYRRAGGRIEIASVQDKPIEWFEPLRDSSVVFTHPNTSQQETFATGVKFLMARRNPTYRNPYGEALLSRAYWPWFFRHNHWRFWMQFLERFADPLLIGSVEDPDAFITAVQSLGMQSVVGVGVGEKVEAVTPELAGEFERVEITLGHRIQKLILGQTLTSDVGKSGSYAAAKVHNEVRDDKRRSDIKLIVPAVQDLVDALWNLNDFPGEAPAFVLQDDTGLESERATRDATLATAGVVRFKKDYLINRYDFEPDEIEVPEAQQTPAAGMFSAKLAARKPGKPQRFTQDQAAVEQLIAGALDTAAPPISTKALRSAILAAKDPEDLAERLGEIYEGEDAEEFVALMERALFTADVLGFETAENRTGV